MAVVAVCASLLVALPAKSGAFHAAEARPVTAAAAHYKLQVLAGSAKYVVYSKFALKPNGRPAKHGTVFVKTLHGKPQRVKSVTKRGLGFTIDRSMLVWNTGSVFSPTVHWRNLNTGAHGTAAAREGGAAAPGGWVTVVADVANDGDGTLKIDRHTTRGKTTRLKTVHFGDGDVYDIAVGGNTLVLDQPEEGGGNGTASWMSFSHLGVFHTFITAKHGGIADCSSITEKYIGCAVDKTGPAMRLYTVHGKFVVGTTGHCPAASPAVLGGSIAWAVGGEEACPPGRVTILSPTGKVSFAKGTTSSFPPVAAFDNAVVANRAGNKLVLVSSNGHKRVLVQTN